MGICMSELRDDLISRDIDKANEKSFQKAKSIYKLLLLGAGESGKSTLFKQILNSFGKGFTEDDRLSYRRAIYNNTISSMATLVGKVEGNLDVENEDAGTLIANLGDSSSTDTTIDRDELDPEAANAIATLWKDPAIKRTFEKKHDQLQLADNIEHFFDNVLKYTDPLYIPTIEDILKSRVRTTGIVETELVIQQNNFRVIDVGGQRNERTKWIHCFEEVTGVIFVAALSEYDQTLFEHDGCNRMDEALSLFEEISNSRWFCDTSMILFLNKKDIFKEKLKTVPLSVWDTNFKGDPTDLEECTKYLIASFEARNRSHKEVYSHVCCALDEQLVNHLFIAVKDIVIRNTLRELQLD